MGAFDATTKYLIESHPADWLALAGLRSTSGPIRVVDADLSTIRSAPDKVIVLGRGRRRIVVHLEFQSSHDPRLDERILAYNVLARQRHGMPVRSVAFLLRPDAAPPGVRGKVRWSDDGGSTLAFDYQLVRVWTLPVGPLLSGPLGTLPLAPVAAVARPALSGVIRHIRKRLDREVTAPEAGELWTATEILMGLRYNEPEVRTLLRGVRHMRESVTYQAIVDEGRVEGRVQGRVEGRMEGRAEGRVEGEQRLLLQMATTRFGEPTKAAAARLRSVTDLDKLDRLAASLFSAKDWNAWLPAARRRA